MTPRERWWWQATVWMEARGESFTGQRAVAANILHRLRTGRWGHTIAAVVLYPKQYSCWNTDSPTRRALAYLSEESDPSWLSVARACTETELGAPDDTCGALHYYNPADGVPSWDKPEYPRVQIGRHIFVRGVP